MLKRKVSGKDTDDLINKNKEEKLLRDQWKADVDALQNAVKKLSQDYSSHKGDFALGRYDKLKEMIKTAIQEYQTVTSPGNPRPLPASEGNAESGQTEPAKTGLMSRLRNSAKRLSGKAPNKQDSDVAGQSNANLAEENEKLRKEIIRLKHEFRTERDKLKQLSEKYQGSKKYNPTQRYPILKDMIKQVART